MKKYLLISASVVLLYACTSKKESDTAEVQRTETISNKITLTDQQAKNIEIEIVTIEQGAMPSTMRLNARTEVMPQDQISVSNMMGGFVKSIAVLPGTSVKKGQVLAILEDPAYVQLQEDYLTTKALLTKASADYTRQKELNDSQAASTKVMEEARAEMYLLQIKKRALEEKLQLIHISPSQVSMHSMKRSLSVVAPVSGVVNEVFANRGQYVSGAQPIVEMIQSGTPLLNIKAFENNLPYLRVGQEVEAFTNQNTNQKVTAKIVSIAQHVNEDGSVDVLAQITHANGMRFSSNMYFNVEITYESNSAMQLPEASVVHFEGKDYVYEVIGKNTFEWKPVKIGGKANGKVEMLSPMDTSKQYVGKGAYGLLMAMKNSLEE